MVDWLFGLFIDLLTNWLVGCWKAEAWSCVDKIRVCVRKRPRMAREVKLNDRDIVKMSGHQTVIVDEIKVAVDLTKSIQQVYAF